MIRPGGLFAVDFVVQLQEAVLYGVGKAGQFAAQQADGFGEVAVFVGIEDAAGAFVEALVGEQYVGVFVEVGVFFCPRRAAICRGCTGCPLPLWRGRILRGFGCAG